MSDRDAVEVEIAGRTDTTTIFWPRDDMDEDVIREVWEGDSYHLTTEHMSYSGAVLDVGACFGAFTLRAIMLGAQTVLAVEPERANAEKLEEHVRLNGVGGRVTIKRVALDTEPDRPVQTIGTGPTARTVRSEAAASSIRSATLEQLVGWASTLDHRGRASIDVLKLDCEGAELDALGSASHHTLRICRRIVGEFHGGGTGHEDRSEALGRMLANLAETHNLQMFGHASIGGMFYAERYGEAPE